LRAPAALIALLAGGALTSPAAGHALATGVTVDPTVATSYMRLGPGRTRLSLRLGHPPQLSSRPVRVWWFAAPRSSRRFHLVAVSSTRELSPGVTYASATIEPPSARFAYRVCVNPGWGAALRGSGAPQRCPHADFSEGPGAVAPPLYGGEARGIRLAAFPSPAALAAASRFLSTRAGRASFAVIDSRGRLRGMHLHEHFATASVVKVMMLVAYLQMLDAQHRALGAADSALLYPMIHVSDNDAASEVLAIVGRGALARVARAAGMSDYAPAAGWWAFTQTSSADQARLMFALPRLIPSRFYGYARGLLEGVEASQSWGIPPVARPRWRVYFKTGWLPEEGIFTEVARLERHALSFSLAVLTGGEPSKSYGEQTIAGVAAALLTRSPAEALE